jgi:hypothetical protein
MHAVVAGAGLREGAVEVPQAEPIFHELTISNSKSTVAIVVFPRLGLAGLW